MASIKIVLILILTLLLSLSRTSAVTDIPDNIKELCPYSSICNQTAIAQLKTTGKKPCCHQCSCDKLCGLRLNCCFEEYDTFKLVAKGLVDCIEPVEGDAELSTVHNTNFMIKACNFAAEIVGELCKTRDENGNSLIAPVSSTDTGYIYINEECAKCNGLELFREWEALIFYNARKYFTFIRLDFTESLNNKISALLYTPPAGDDWHNLQCFKNTDLAGFKCEANEYLDMCKHLYAPYTSLNGLAYKNVYCKICEDNNSKIELDCEDDDAEKHLLANFGMLIDMKEVNALRQDNRIEYFPSIIGLDCNNDNTPPVQLLNISNGIKDKDCLQVYCPEGQIETQKGCAYLGHWWYSTFFNLQVKLIPSGSNKLLLSTVLRLSTTEKKSPFSWIRPPCRDGKLNAITVYYKRSGNDTEKENVESLILVVGRNADSSNGFDPSVVIPLMKLCIDKIWSLTINSTSYLFTATFDDYMRSVQDGVQRLTKYLVENGNFIEEKQPRPPMYEVLLSTESTMSIQDYRKMDRIGIRLRKSYFCKQVRVPIDDIETDYGTITILSKNITIGNNKYTQQYYFRDTNGQVKKSTFSVCLDDYMPHETTNSGSFMGMFVGYMMFLIMIFRAIIHFTL